MPPNSNGFLDNLIFSLFAALAGLLGYLMRNLNDRRSVTWQRSFLEASASGVVGVMTVLLCKAVGLSYEWTGFMCGILGWLGATTSIQLFERVVRRKLGLSDVDNNISLGSEGNAHGSADSSGGPSAGR